MFTVWFYERLKVGIQNKGNRKHVLNFVKFQNIVTFFGILDVLGGMLTALWKMILETVFICKGVYAVCTNVSFTMVFCSVTYEPRKTCDQCVVKLVPSRQQQ